MDDQGLIAKLKEAGFPLKKKELCSFQKQYPGAHLYEDPTLEELIEACGEEFAALEQIHKGEHLIKRKEWNLPYWKAHYRKVNSIVAKGKTPSEAVANLWIKLQEK